MEEHQVKWEWTGIDRVVVNRHGDAVSYAKAIDRYEHAIDVAFLRNDGWSLGAPKHLEEVAYELWFGKWIAYARAPTRFWIDIEAYIPKIARFRPGGYPRRTL